MYRCRPAREPSAPFRERDLPMHTAATPTQTPEGNANGRCHFESLRDSARSAFEATSICIGPGGSRRKAARASGRITQRDHAPDSPALHDRPCRTPGRSAGGRGACRSLHPSGGSTTRSGGVTPHLSPRRGRGDPGWNASTVVLFLCYDVVQTY